MKSNIEISKKVQATLDSVDSIEAVNISPFFKEKVMHQIREYNATDTSVKSSWFTPQLQLATFICIIILNVFAFKAVQSSSYDNDINTLAETYGLSNDSGTTSILN